MSVTSALAPSRKVVLHHSSPALTHQRQVVRILGRANAASETHLWRREQRRACADANVRMGCDRWKVHGDAASHLVTGTVVVFADHAHMTNEREASRWSSPSTS